MSSNSEVESSSLDDTDTPISIIKYLRRVAEAKFCSECEKIKGHIAQGGHPAVLEVRKENLQSVYDDCVAIHHRYLKKLEAADLDTTTANEWLLTRGDELKEALNSIAGYLPPPSGSQEEILPALTDHPNALGEDSNTTPLETSKSPAPLAEQRDTERPPSFHNILNSTTLPPNRDGVHALTIRLEASQRKLQEDLEDSKILQMRKEEDLKRAADREQRDLTDRLLAAGGAPILTPADTGKKRDSSGRIVTQDTHNRSLPTPMSVTPLALDSWIFEPFQAPPDGADIAGAAAFSMILAAMPKEHTDLFNGDPKRWPTFIQEFKDTVHNMTPFPGQRISLLRKMLHPELRNKFSQLLASPLTYQKALQELWSCYGRPHLIVQTYIRELRNITALKEYDLSSLENFHQSVHGAVVTLEEGGYGHELNSSIAVTDLAEKLPRSLAVKWGQHVYKLLKNNPTGSPNLLTLDAWLSDIVMAEKLVPRPKALPPSNQPYIRRPFFLKGSSFNKNPPQTTLSSVLALTTGANEDSSEKCEAESYGCLICKDPKGHGPTVCNTFMSMTPSERLRVLREIGNCFRCLGRRHREQNCKKTESFCTASGCGATHHPLLHGAEGVAQRKSRNEGP